MNEFRTMAQQGEDAAAALTENLKQATATAAQTARERAGFSSTMISALRRQVAALTKELKPNEEIGALLTNFGVTVLVTVTSITSEEPHLIIIKGFDDNEKEVFLFQHVSQVNILFRKKEAKPGSQARRIGFATGTE